MKLFQWKQSFIFGIFILSFYFTFNLPRVESKNGLQIDWLQNEEKKIFEMVNIERRRNSIGLLEWNPDLAELARLYSKKMARERFFSHFDKQGNSVADRAKSLKITKWKRIGENLFKCEGCTEYPQIAIKGWKESPSHRRNMLNENFNQTGIGVAVSSDGTVYVTQVFLQS